MKFRSKIFPLILAICAIVGTYTLNNKIYANSIDFKFIIDTVGIPEYNVNGSRINDDIYYKYNIFVYSDPISIKSKTHLQRFKEVKDKGKWKENSIQGEYYILGEDYNGDFVCNVYFPVDEVPTSLPKNWNFISSVSNVNSWNDSSKYRYKEQLNYMKEQQLLFDKIDLVNKTADSYNLVKYDISPIKVGLDKFMLNTSATWRTNGIVTAKRNVGGKVMEAIFAVEPMCADADIVSFVDVDDKAIINEEEDEVYLDISYGCNVLNLNDYAKVEHIKGIKSIIYINGKEVDFVSSSKVDCLKASISYKVLREDINKKEYPLKISVLSFLYTEFNVDGLIQDTVDKEVTIYQQEKLLEALNDIKLGTIKKDNMDIFFKPLNMTLECKENLSCGIAELGRELCLKLSLNTINIADIEIYINGVLKENRIIKNENNEMFIGVKLNNEIGSTLYDVATLREKYQSIFKINRNLIATRKAPPNEVCIYVYTLKNEYMYNLFFDTMSNYILNVNETLDIDLIDEESYETIKIN